MAAVGERVEQAESARDSWLPTCTTNSLSDPKVEIVVMFYESSQRSPKFAPNVQFPQGLQSYSKVSKKQANLSITGPTLSMFCQ